MSIRRGRCQRMPSVFQPVLPALVQTAQCVASVLAIHVLRCLGAWAQEMFLVRV